MDSYLATILPVAFNYATEGWLMCWGQKLAVNQYTAVFSLVSNFYGGDQQTYFNLPDLRGRMPIGYGQRVATSPVYEIGSKGGNDSISLTSNQLPAHAHAAVFTPTGHATVNIPAQEGTQTAALKASPAAGTSQLPTTGSTLAGGNTAATRIYGAASSAPVTLDSSSVSISGNAPTAARSILTDAITGGAVTVQPFGAGASIDARPPYLAINFIFCVQDVYPVRQ